jgi:hypothetical protein
MYPFAQFWLQMVEESVPPLHLHHFSSDFHMVAWSVMCDTADDSVMLMESGGESAP